MCRSDDVGARRVNSRVDRERGRIDRPIANDDLATVVHQQQVADFDLRKVHAVRIHPEMIEQFWVASGDVASGTFTEAHASKDAEGGSKMLFSVLPLLFSGRERGHLWAWLHGHRLPPFPVSSSHLRARTIKRQGGPGWRGSSTTTILSKAGRMPLVQLREMTASEFDDLRGSMIIEYAAEQIRDGLVEADDAYAAAKGHFDELLPGGLHTPEMRLLSGDLEDHRLIGYVWFAVRLDTSSTVDAWLYGIEVLPRQRGKGYGRALLSAVELTAAGLGATSLGLNVFASNAIARQLYASAGYELTAQQMRKPL